MKYLKLAFLMFIGISVWNSAKSQGTVGTTILQTPVGSPTASNIIPDAILVNGDATNGIYIGKGKGSTNTTGRNVAIGAINPWGASYLYPLGATQTADRTDNIAIGASALLNLKAGGSNIGIGLNALNHPLQAVSNNIAMGSSALFNCQSDDNIAIGASALTLATGNSINNMGRNIAIGSSALSTVTTGTNNIGIGYFSSVPNPAGDGQLSIQNLIYGIGGLVGIGTSSPGSKLDIKGTLRLSGSTSGYVGFAPAAAAGSTTYTLPTADGTSGQMLTTNGSATLRWSTPPSASGITSLCSTVGQIPYTSSAGGNLSCSNITYDNTNSYVGIGTTSPAATLHVNGTLRLENLPTNSPTNFIHPLLIDANGDVYIGNGTQSRPAATSTDDDSRISSLEEKVNNLSALVELLMASNSPASNKLFSISPNPAKGQIHVEPVKTLNTSSKSIEVRDINNVTVIAKTPFNGTITLSINDSLSSGTYLVVIYDNDKVIQTEKVSVIK